MIDTVRDWERSARCRDSVRCFASCVSTASPRRVKAVLSRGGGEERALSYSDRAALPQLHSLRGNTAKLALHFARAIEPRGGAGADA